MKIMTRIVQLSVLFVATFSMSTAMACTTGAWSGGVTGDPAPLNDTPESALPRVSGKCGMTLTAAGTVKDDSPVQEDQVFIRFYVLGEISSEVTIFEAYSDDSAAGGTELISISYDGTNFIFDAFGNAGATKPSDPIPGRAGWNIVTMAWNGTTLAFKVNSGMAVEEAGTIDAKAGTMESVILGALTDPGAGGKLVFDDYEAHRETEVGPLLTGDANGSGGLTIADVIGLFNELNGTLSEGQPDCNLSGSITIADVICLFNAL